MDGYQATCALRSMNFTAPICILTANALPEEKVKAFDAGASDWTSKPIRKKELLNVLKRLLPNHQPNSTAFNDSPQSYGNQAHQLGSSIATTPVPTKPSSKSNIKLSSASTMLPSRSVKENLQVDGNANQSNIIDNVSDYLGRLNLDIQATSHSSKIFPEDFFQLNYSDSSGAILKQQIEYQQRKRNISIPPWNSRNDS